MFGILCRINECQYPVFPGYANFPVVETLNAHTLQKTLIQHPFFFCAVCKPLFRGDPFSAYRPEKADVEIHFPSLFLCWHPLPLYRMPARWTWLLMLHSLLAQYLLCFTFAMLGFARLFLFIHRGSQCTFHFLIPSPLVSFDSQFAYVSEIQAVHWSSSSLQEKVHQAVC